MVFARAFGVASACVLMAALATPSYAQEKGQDKSPDKMKLNRAEMAQYQALRTLVDAVMAGKQPAPADVTLKFQNHFVRSATNVFVPYVLEISSGKFSSFPVAMYVRAVQKPGAAAAGKKPNEYPFENIYFFADSKSLASTGSDTAEVSRALDLPAGEYDVYIAISETPPKNGGAANPGKRVLLVQPLTVPDFSTGLTTSTVILAKRMEEAPQQLTAQQQLEQPFTLGGYKLTPTFTSMFPKSGELLFVFLIYNEGVTAGNKPDLAVDFNVFRAAEARPFSKMATMLFNATTLPTEFSLAAGHQVIVGQGMPLGSFVPGDYKLEIKITDKTGDRTVLRNVPFTVVP